MSIDSRFVLLAVIGLLNSVVAAYCYLRVMVYIYMNGPEPGASTTALEISAVLAVLLGLTPSGTLDAAILADR